MQASTEESAITHQHQMNMVFANCSEEDVNCPLTVKKIAQAQEEDAALQKLSKTDKYSTQLIEGTQVLCKDGKMVIPKFLQRRAVSWYHHYLQHPGHTRIEETLHAAMYRKGMRNTIRSHVKNCRTCQVNQQHKHKYGILPTQLVITNPWETLCVDLIGPYTLKGKDGIEIYFMCLTMIDPASRWFEIGELPVATDAVIPMDTKGQKGTTSQWSSSLCTKQRKYTNHKIFVSEKQYPKRCFLLRKRLRNIPYLSKGVSQ
jgi:hypothetical protein